MSPAEALRALDQTPLIGRGREEAEALCRRVQADLASQPDPEIALRLKAWVAILLLVDGRPGATEALLEAARAAEEAGEARLALRCGLYAVRALAAVGRSASAAELLADLRPAAEAMPALGGELRLAEASAGHPDPRRQWEEALERLATPGRDSDRAEALLGLGVMARDGEDVVRARAHWRRGLELCEARGDVRGTLRFATLLGNLLLEAGQNREAREALVIAVGAAEALGDTLVVLAEATLLCALELGAEDWVAAERAAGLIEEAAAKRNNHHALAEAAISRSACRIGQGDTAGGLRALIDAAARLRERGSVGGLNLLKARLGELRIGLTPAVFDPLWQRLMGISRPQAASPPPAAPVPAAPAPTPATKLDKGWGGANKLKG